MEPSPTRLRSPDALAALIAVNITPLAGIVFLGWLPSAVLISYFVDTFVGFGVVMLMIMVHVTGDNEAGPIVGWKRWTKALMGLAILGAIFAFPLAFPIFFLYADDRETLALLRNTDFLLALAVQVLMSLLAAARMHRMLQATHDDEKILAARTLFLAARWFALFIAMVTGFIGMLGPGSAVSCWSRSTPARRSNFEPYPETCRRSGCAQECEAIDIEEISKPGLARKRA
jgi:hypothetical protein